MHKAFAQICVLGAGLLGSSLLMAAKKRGLCGRAVLWSRGEATRAKARTQPWCDTVFETPEEAVKDADLIVLCTPVETIPALMEQIAPHVGPGAIVTDVGSVKGAICAAGAKILPENFVGSHPMAGSEKTGLGAARENLFENRTCFAVPCRAEPRAVETLTQFWDALGAKTQEVDAAKHDEIVARVSHLPHAVANILCATLAQSPAQWKEFSGNGLRDTTRIAASDPELWRQIFAQNRPALLAALDDFSAELSGLRDALERGDDRTVKNILSRASAYRSDWPNP